MSTINAPSLANVEYSGQDASAHAHGYIVLAAAQITDKVRLNKLYAGTKIYAAKFINAALGAASTIALGYEYVDGSGSGVLIAATSTAAAGSPASVSAPVTLTSDAYITATVAGGAVTGQFDSVLTFEHRGTL